MFDFCKILNYSDSSYLLLMIALSNKIAITKRAQGYTDIGPVTRFRAKDPH